jgi:hypothetical protein
MAVMICLKYALQTYAENLPVFDKNSKSSPPYASYKTIMALFSSGLLLTFTLASILWSTILIRWG